MPNYSQIEPLLTSAAQAMETRPYQLAGVKFARRQQGGLIELIMGSGKTLIVLSSIFCFKPNRILILCPKNAFWTWFKQIEKWYPGVVNPLEYAVLKGVPEKRARIWANPDARIFVCTYATWRIDKDYVTKTLKLKFAAVIADELDRVGKYKAGKNKKTNKPQAQNYKALYALLREQNPLFIGTAGKLRKKGRQDLWHWLHMVDPKVWSSYWKFVYMFCDVQEGMWGKEIVGTRNDEAFLKAIRPYLYTSDSAEKYLPPLIRQYLWVEMDDAQRKIYQELEKNRYSLMESGEIIWANNPLSLFTRHRQLLICPKLLDASLDYGPGLEAIVEKAKEADNSHFAIWTAYPRVIPHIVEYLNSQGYKNIVTLRGGDSELDVQRVETTFRNDPHTIFVGSIRFAQSYELETCVLQFFLGPDWDVYENASAEARARRITTTDPINSFFIHHIGTIEERVYQVLDTKDENVRRTYAGMEDFEEYWAT